MEVIKLNLAIVFTRWLALDSDVSIEPSLQSSELQIGYADTG